MAVNCLLLPDLTYILCSYGWLCKPYKESCYWWEMMYLEARFLTLLTRFISRESEALGVQTIITIVMALMHLRLKPFEETEVEASGGEHELKHQFRRSMFSIVWHRLTSPCDSGRLAHFS